MLQFSRNVPKITERSASALRVLDSPALHANPLARWPEKHAKRWTLHFTVGFGSASVTILRFD
jgi:hypothetical protein